ncbi:hypothetical protein K443DRAFT_685161 [Laccaria amethystina LaAM-08-1]|uniref:Unplaced genomic scaffold K443scaffold_364, whole genome shotgun sequence n=1 Tax=Laccaria amethystina LaAM-08-1 TaxID=1095629 RepID=A0A0C9X4P4_9AGAR|nr:hypothetical protein K443DRAFT_685161 [Laccaria amethystina LaAM-08-1]
MIEVLIAQRLWHIQPSQFSITLALGSGGGTAVATWQGTFVWCPHDPLAFLLPQKVQLTHT